MERHQRADEVVRRRARASADLRRRALAAKKPAYRIRQAMLGSAAGGTVNLLDDELAAHSLDDDVEGVARRALTAEGNNRVTNADHQAIDAVVMLTVKQNLPASWDPGRAELAQVARNVVALACVYAATVHRLRENFFARPDHETWRLRFAAWLDAKSMLEEALMAELLCGPVDPASADGAVLAGVLRDAEERLVCRSVVLDAILAMAAEAFRNAADADVDAWEAVVNVPGRAYEMIEDQGDAPSYERATREGQLTVLAKRRAAEVGGVDEGLLLALVKVTAHRFARKRLGAAKREAVRREAILPYPPLPDPDVPSSNSPLDDKAPPGPSFEDGVISRVDDEKNPVVETIFGPITAAEGPAPAGAAAGGPGPSLADDVLRLVWLCHVVTDGDAPGWLARQYVPETSAKQGRMATIWSSCQAVWPHFVLWPGDAGTPTNRVRRFVSEVVADIRQRRPGPYTGENDER